MSRLLINLQPLSKSVWPSQRWTQPSQDHSQREQDKAGTAANSRVILNVPGHRQKLQPTTRICPHTLTLTLAPLDEIICQSITWHSNLITVNPNEALHTRIKSKTKAQALCVAQAKLANEGIKVQLSENVRITLVKRSQNEKTNIPADAVLLHYILLCFCVCLY